MAAPAKCTAAPVVYHSSMTTPPFDRALIDRYEAGAELLAPAIAGLSNAELDAHPIAGTWTIRQIVVHLLESELAAAHRMRRIIAEDRPLVIAYDETRMAESCFYEHEDMVRVCRMFADTRRMMSGVLRRLPDEAFARACVHNQNGLVTLARMVEMYAGHLSHHMKFLLEKRRLLGKPIDLKAP